MSLSELIRLRDLWVAALEAVTTGQNYSVEGLSVSRVDAALIQENIDRYNRDIDNLQRQQAGGRPGVATPTWT